MRHAPVVNGPQPPIDNVRHLDRSATIFVISTGAQRSGETPVLCDFPHRPTARPPEQGQRPDI